MNQLLTPPLGGRGAKRIQSFDLARGFTVLIMPSIHVVMLYSLPQVQQSFLGNALAFIAEGPGAQLFMLLMGVNFALRRSGSSSSSFGGGREEAQRTFYLLLAAYSLNFFKFIVPLLFGWMPQNLLQELQLQNDGRAKMFFLLLGDILHFAAIAYPILFLVYSLKHYPYWSLAIAITIMFLSPFVWDIKTGFSFSDYILQLLGDHPPQAFFPVFPWLVYPLLGLSLGYFLRLYDSTSVMKKAGWGGAIIMFVSCLFPPTKPQSEWLPFYRTGPVDTLFHSGFVFTWLAIFHWLSRKIRSNQFFYLLIFCSKNITAIYIIQWILIFWCIGISGYLTQAFPRTFCWMIGITVSTLLLTQLINYARKHK